MIEQTYTIDVFTVHGWVRLEVTDDQAETIRQQLANR